MRPFRPLWIAFAGILAGCSPAPPDAPPPPEPSAERSEAPLALPDDAVVVSTNEPFWQARVDGGVLVLTGVDAPARRLSGVVMSWTSEGQRFSARDEAGAVEVVVRRMPCEDSMSGARFPMTGLLMIDGHGPFRGCARPASMPQPRPPEEEVGRARVLARDTSAA